MMRYQNNLALIIELLKGRPACCIILLLYAQTPLRKILYSMVCSLIFRFTVKYFDFLINKDDHDHEWLQC